MSPILKDAKRSSCWQVEVLGAPSGELELYLTEAGYVWYWSGKPQHLVPLAGVLDDHSPENRKPYRFCEFEGAVAHLMHCTGIAFCGQCGLAAAR